MKVLSAGLLFLSAGMVFAGGKSENAAGNTIDDAIAVQGRYVVERSENNVSVAIVQISSPNEKLSKYIVDELPNYIIGNDKGVIVVERQQLELIENEVAYQLSGSVSDDEVISIGNRIGAQLVVTGSVAQIGDALRLNIKVIDVETAGMVGSHSCDITIDKKVKALLSDNGQIALAADIAGIDTENQKKRTLFKDDFSNGFYLGYIYSPITPLGLSEGWLANERLGLYFDSELRIPSFDEYKSNGATYDRDGVHKSYGKTYLDQNRTTHFVWEEIMGMNGALYAPYLWLSVGIGFNYDAEYRLFKEHTIHYSWDDDEDDNDDDGDDDGDAEWYAPELGNFDFLLQAGLHVKLKHILLSFKYKHIFNYGSSFDVGIGYVWKLPVKNSADVRNQ
jgi:TolB-like protein